MSSIEIGSTHLPVLKAISHNLRSLPRAASWTALLSGLLVVFVSTTGPIAILYQATDAAKLSTSLTNSWLFAVFMGSGLFGLLLSLRYGMPIIGSWASTTTALLVSGLVDHSFSDVIGAYIGASLLLMVVGYTGFFNRLMKSIPQPIIMAMLAGVLLVFGTRIFTSTQVNPILGFMMLVVYFVGRTMKLRAPLLGAFAVGLVTVILQSKVSLPSIPVRVVEPVWTNPTFSIGTFLTLTIPIFLMVMTTQNAPGLALLKAVDYEPPVNQIVHVGGFLSLLGAGFGGAGVNISAMTATIAISSESDPNPKTRYFAGVVSGVAYCLAALFAGVFSSLYGAFPIELTAILAGLALLPVIMSALHDAVIDKGFRDAAVVTFLVTISGVSGWGVGAPFWGLISGMVVSRISRWSTRNTPKKIL